MKLNVRFWIFIFLGFACWAASEPIPAGAIVTVQGRVMIWNPITTRYEPLRGVKVLVDFRAHLQIGPLDHWRDLNHEDQARITDEAGEYSVEKPDAFGIYDRHQVKVIVLAEIPDKLKIQDGPLPDGPYQFETNWVTALNQSTTVVDVRLGGAEETAGRGYGVNGSWHFWEAAQVPAELGLNAFHILKCIRDHQEQLCSGGGFVDADFRYKWVWFPYEADNSFYSALGFMAIVRSAFDADFHLGCSSARHEATHALVADIYLPWMNPGVSGTQAGVATGQDHILQTEWPTQANAFNEALSEFFAKASMRRQYRNLAASADAYANELEGCPAWCTAVMPAADRSRVEGHVAAVLWDIYDGDGQSQWESRRVQETDIPGVEEFMDAFSDPDFTQTATVLKQFQPQALTHVESGQAQGGNFINRWLNQSVLTSVHAVHYFKAFLFNRGINSPDFRPNRPPTVAIDNLYWSNLELNLELVIRETDEEDRQFCWLDMFVGDQRVVREMLSPMSDWDGEVRRAPLRYVFPSALSGWNLVLTVAAHDDMGASFQKRTLQIPALSATPLPVCAQITQLAVNLDGMGPPGFGPSSAKAFLVTRASHHELLPTATIRMPQEGTWTLPARGTFAHTSQDILLTTDNLAEEVLLDFDFHLILEDHAGNQYTYVATEQRKLYPQDAPWNYNSMVLRLPQSGNRPFWLTLPPFVEPQQRRSMPLGAAVEIHCALRPCP
jgi:hypothetical protein